MRGSGLPWTQPRIRVLCADDSEDIATLLCRMARREPDIDIVGVAHDTPGMAEAVERLRPDVLVMDLSMPGGDPLGFVRALAVARSGVRVVVFSGYDEEGTRIAVFDSGAWGFVSKHATPGEVFDAIRRVAGGEAHGMPGRA